MNEETREERSGTRRVREQGKLSARMNGTEADSLVRASVVGLDEVSDEGEYGLDDPALVCESLQLVGAG